MLDANNLASVLERIMTGTHSDADIQVLSQALQEGHIALATAERAVAVGGDVNDTVIVTGDGNVVRIFKGSDADTIRQLFEHILESHVPRTLLTHAEFWARAEQPPFIRHQGPLTGREAVLEQVKAHLAGPTCVTVVHGLGGIGKTRLLLALPSLVPDRTFLWYVRTEAESIERDLTMLERNCQ